MVQNKHQLVDDDPDYDLDGYYIDTNKNSEIDNNWLFIAAGLLGAAFVTQSLNPTGPIETPNLADNPISVDSIPDETFASIMKMDIAPINIEVSTTKMEYIYSQDELNQFKQLQDYLLQHGRLEDPRTIENTSMRWAEQSNDKMGMFTDIEAYKSGSLDAYIQAQIEYGASIEIPWNPTGPNTCDDCMAMVDEGPFEPQNFPPPVHFGDQCNDPMADPIIVFPTGQDSEIPMEG